MFFLFSVVCMSTDDSPLLQGTVPLDFLLLIHAPGVRPSERAALASSLLTTRHLL